ncbi:MAG: YtxH domain-containing protein [Actinomycetota bacterium]|nr:YtxH domain-containing protein [Actinomycetota bacterium]
MLDKQRLRTFLLGGAAGLLTGILLAPRSGRELRGSLANRAGEAHERGRETYFDAQEQMRERLAEFREGARRPPDPTSEAQDPTPSPGESGAARLHLRDVSYGSDERVAGAAAGGEAERSEELRRKVRETRERLRGRKDQDLGPER